MKRIALKFVLVLGLGTLAFSSRADTHIFAGALSTNQNGKLIFGNGNNFDAALTTYSFPQVLRTNGLNAGYHRGDVLTFSALAATSANNGPITNCAAPGARLAIQVASVAGPAGGSFAFWEGDGENDLGTITFSVPVGTTNGTNYLVVSENIGEPGADPYGHIHGREFTTSLPGTYLVGFRVIDLSTNGTGGGPIQTPSDILLMRFQAGMRIESIQSITNRVTVSFRSPLGISNALEATSSLLAGPWQTIGTPLRGNNNVQSITETNAPGSSRYYRLHQLNTLP